MSIVNSCNTQPRNCIIQVFFTGKLEDLSVAVAPHCPLVVLTHTREAGCINDLGTKALDKEVCHIENHIHQGFRYPKGSDLVGQTVKTF